MSRSAQTIRLNLENRPTIDPFATLESSAIAIDLRSRPDLTPAARTVWIFLYRAYHAFHGRLYTSLGYIASEVGYSIRTVRRALRQLEQAHLVTLMPQIRQPNPRTRKGGGGNSTWRFRIHWKPYVSTPASEPGLDAPTSQSSDVPSDLSEPTTEEATRERCAPNILSPESTQDHALVNPGRDSIPVLSGSDQNAIRISINPPARVREPAVPQPAEPLAEPASMTGAPRSFCPPLGNPETRMDQGKAGEILQPILSTPLQEVNQPGPQTFVGQTIPSAQSSLPKTHSATALQSSVERLLSPITQSIEKPEPTTETLLTDLQQMPGLSRKQATALIDQHGALKVTEVLQWVRTAPPGHIRHPKAWLVAALNDGYELPSWMHDAQSREIAHEIRLADIDAEATERRRQEALAHDQRQATEAAWKELSPLLTGAVGHRLAAEVTTLLSTQIPDRSLRHRVAYPESPIWRAAWLTVWEAAGCPKS